MQLQGDPVFVFICRDGDSALEGWSIACVIPERIDPAYKLQLPSWGLADTIPVISMAMQRCSRYSTVEWERSRDLPLLGTRCHHLYGGNGTWKDTGQV